MPQTRRTFLGATVAAAAGSAVAADADEPNAAELRSENLADEKSQSAEGRQLATDAIHAGQEQGFSVTPVYFGKNFRGQYQRPATNPTVRSFEAKMIALEGGADATSGPTGMSIIAQTHLALLKSGDRIVAHRCNYDAVMELLRERLPQLGIDVALIDMNDPDKLRRALKKKTRVVHWEPYVNPTMEVLPSQDIIRLAREHGAITVCDNTWLTPYLYQPLRYGADIAVHSATKYIGGHGSAMGGVATGADAATVRVIRRASRAFGGILRPADASLLDQGLKTLPMRVERHSASSQKIAEWLADHPRVAQVRYGGLDRWQEKQSGTPYVRGYAGMIGVEWKDDATHTAFARKLKLCKPWGSLGDVVTLVSTRQPEKDRGIPPRYTRIAIGLEDPRDIIADFKQALGG